MCDAAERNMQYEDASSCKGLILGPIVGLPIKVTVKRSSSAQCDIWPHGIWTEPSQSPQTHIMT